MASSYIKRTFGAPTDQNKWTFSGWVKLGQVTTDSVIFSAGTNASNNIDGIKMDTQSLRVFSYPGSYVYHLISDRKFRDLSGWYHVQVAYDSDQGTAADRVKCYINGTQLTGFSTESYPSSGANSGHINLNGREHIIGSDTGGANNNIDGYVTHIHFADGQAYAPTVFGETDSTSGIWKPKTAPTVTYGNNGFFLKFENSAALGTDSSGNGNNFTVVGTPTQSPDTPSNNFCVINPLDTYFFENNDFSNGNLTVSGNNSSFTFCTSTLGVSAGKWYMEAKLSAAAGGGTRIGVVGRTSTAINEGLGDRQDEIAHQTNGDLKVNGTTTSSWGSTWTVGDIIGIALDLDNNKIYFSKNGTYQASGNPSTAANGVTITAADSTTNGVYRFGFGDNNSTGTCTFQYNFGSGYFGTTAVASANADGNGIGAFEYAVPTGYYAVCTKNIKEFGG